jgi:hypothetical protein
LRESPRAAAPFHFMNRNWFVRIGWSQSFFRLDTSHLRSLLMMTASRSRHFRPSLSQLPDRLAPSGGGICPMDPVLIPSDPPPPPIVINPMARVLIASPLFDQAANLIQ